MEQIVCKDLSIGYDNKVLVSGLNINICEGDYLCILGENGTGKSTFVKTVLGLLTKLGGQIEYKNGISNRLIGYLPQRTSVGKDFPATVMEVVMSGFQNKRKFNPFYKKEEKTIAKSALKRLFIEDAEKKCFRELSGGQQQKVLLARALCSAQKIIILDEPVAGLDPIATNEMYNIIQSLNKEGLTVLMITHDVGTSLKYANKILFLCEDTFFGTKEEFKNSKLGQKHKHFVGGCCSYE